jgi:hypothetical protein
LETAGYGSLKRSVQLYQVRFDPDNVAEKLEYEPVVTHIFFPSKEILWKAFFASDLPQQRLPEFTTRLYLGASQIGLVYFGEEVLSRYLNHPEHYEINDSLAGGVISSLSPVPEDRYLHVRYGKCPLVSGQIVVTAINWDLSEMSPSEQSYWHSYEIDSPELDWTDIHFRNFLRRTYGAGFVVEFDNPIDTLLQAIAEVNKSIGSIVLFKKVSNAHLRLPVEQTYKSYCDVASELYKLVGPDNMSQSWLKLVLKDFWLQSGDLKHESGRPLSTLQLLELVEQKLCVPGLLTTHLCTIKELRVDADHRILEPESTTKSYSREFADLCDGLARALVKLAELLTQRAK